MLPRPASPTYTPGPELISSKAVSHLPYLMGSPTWHQNSSKATPSGSQPCPSGPHSSCSQTSQPVRLGAAPDNCSICCQDSQLASLVANHTCLVYPQQLWPDCNRKTHAAHTEDTPGAPSSGDLGELPHKATQDTFYIRQCFQD